MSNVFFISDTHFGHRGLLLKTREDGSPLRPFSSVEEMHEVLVSNWNSVVSKRDVVYHLGDLFLGRFDPVLVCRLRGIKSLVMGNHDLDSRKYAPYFTLYGAKVLKGLNWILTHVPIHESSLSPRFSANIHGHLHHRDPPSPRHFNVSVERIGYTPIAVEDLRRLLPPSL